MNNEQDSKSTVQEPTVKSGPKYYLTRPATPAAIKIATLRPAPQTEEEK